MKTMTCKQMGGACEKVFQANTFEEMAKMSQEHGMEMMQQQDPAHMTVIMEMMKLMQDPGGMAKWVEGKKQEFDAIPHD